MKMIFKYTLSLVLLVNFYIGIQAQYKYHERDRDRDRYEYEDDYRHDRYDEYDDEYRHRDFRKIQLALVLDASGSMDKLLYQAKSQLWDIVNGVSYQYGSHRYMPRLEIALYTYGSREASHRNGYVKQLVSFTQELDWVASELEYLHAEGKREYAGLAIERVCRELKWSRRNDVLKLIYIAGNESMDQGPVSFRHAIRGATDFGIQVHTIYCGDYQKGVHHQWKKAAYLGNGTYQSIDLEYRRPYRSSPHDGHLSQLNIRLNSTYIPFGTYGRSRFERQRIQDERARSHGRGRLSERIVAKASPNYYNESWDLVDAVSAGHIRIQSIPERDLPLEMRGMTTRQKIAYIERKKSERQHVAMEIQQLGRKRKQFVDSKVSTKNKTRSTLQDAIVRSAKKNAVDPKIRVRPMEEGRDQAKAKLPESRPIRSGSYEPSRKRRTYSRHRP